MQIFKMFKKLTEQDNRKTISKLVLGFTHTPFLVSLYAFLTTFSKRLNIFSNKEVNKKYGQDNRKEILGKVLGFTLIEIIFGVSIFILIFMALAFFSRNTWIYTSFFSAGLNEVDAGRQITRTMVTEIRKASNANTGAYVINLATSSAFTFYSDINNDGLKEKVRYFFSNNSLKKGVTQPTGNPLIYNSSNEKITTFISNVTNSSIFNYYDTNYDGTTTSLPFPVAIPSIRLVKITITEDKDPNRPPKAFTFSTQVSIRNLKDNL